MKAKGIKSGTIAARVGKRAKEFFTGFTLQSSGSVSSLVLEAFPGLYNVTVKKIKDLFTERELLAIIATHNGFAMTPGMLVDVWWHISEAIKYGALEFEVEGFNKDEIIKKAKTLTLFESFVVGIWATNFWYGPDAEGRNILEYVRKENHEG